MGAEHEMRLSMPCDTVPLVDGKGARHAAIAWSVWVDHLSDVRDRWQVYRLCNGDDGALLGSGCVDGREAAMGEAMGLAGQLGLAPAPVRLI